jgi:hypothetical protein
VFHDRDPSLDPGWVGRLLEHLGRDVRYLTAAEYCGYLHARIERAPAADGPFALRVEYDGTHGDFFRHHPSTWVLHLADETRAALPGPTLEQKVIVVPAGLGPHTVR